MISPLAHIDHTAKIGSDVTIHPFAFVDANTVIGDGAVIMPYASVMKDTRVGARTKIYNGAIVGADPQDFRWDGKTATCTIGDDCVIRENVIINRGFMSTQGTFIGDGSFIMATSHIGHDCHIAGKCVIGNGVTMAGNIEIGSCSILSSNSVIHEGSKIGDWVLIKGGCRISGNVPPYVIIAHNPASYFGINAHIMRKGNFTDDQIDDVAKAYRHIYQCGTSVFNALKRIQADIEDSPIRQNILDFINGNNLRIVAVPVDLE